MLKYIQIFYIKHNKKIIKIEMPKDESFKQKFNFESYYS